MKYIDLGSAYWWPVYTRSTQHRMVFMADIFGPFGVIRSRNDVLIGTGKRFTDAS